VKAIKKITRIVVVMSLANFMRRMVGMPGNGWIWGSAGLDRTGRRDALSAVIYKSQQNSDGIGLNKRLTINRISPGGLP
jgi:hypothetical protein